MPICAVSKKSVIIEKNKHNNNNNPPIFFFNLFQFDQKSSPVASSMSCACPKTVSNWFDSLKRRLALRERNSYTPLKPEMVQGIDLVQVDVAFLTYNPKR
jgi:hypothetical protein